MLHRHQQVPVLPVMALRIPTVNLRISFSDLNLVDYLHRHRQIHTVHQNTKFGHLHHHRTLQSLLFHHHHHPLQDILVHHRNHHPFLDHLHIHHNKR